MIGLLLPLALAAEPTVDDGADALDAYRAARLDVVERDVSTVYAKGYDGSGRFWFATRGGRSLGAADFAEAVGDLDRARTHRRRGRTSAGVGLGSVLLGMAATSLGVVYTVRRSRASEAVQPEVVGACFGLGAVGVVGGTVALSRRVRSVHPSTLYTEDEARARAQQANATLRQELLGAE